MAAIGEGVLVILPAEAPSGIQCPPDLTIPTCGMAAAVHYRAAYGTNRHISCFPPPGTLFTLGAHTVQCFATNECGGTLSNGFLVTVRPPVPGIPCPQPLPGMGIPFEAVGGAVAVYPPAGASSTVGPSLELIPDALNPDSGLHLQPGPAQALSFVAVLDFTAPMGAGFDLVLPPNSMNTNDTPILSFRNKGPKGYCVKMNKRFADEPTGAFRAAVVNTNGHLLDTLEFSADEMRTNDVMVIGFQPGVTSVHVAVEVDCLTGGVTVEFEGPVAPSVEGRKGWDGCIYGPDRPVKKPKARLVVTPPMVPGTPPITDLFLYASGVAELVLEEPAITARGRKWSDGHVTLMKAYDDGSEQGMRFTPVASGGVTVDLGYTASFDLRLRHFETGDVPTEEQLLTRTLGPIRGLTNRPPPPFLDAMLLKTNAAIGGVNCAADFRNLGSPTVLVQIFNGGMLVAERAGVPATLDTPLFNMSDWPTRLGKLGGATPCRRGKPPLGVFRLPAGGGMPPMMVVGDEFRVLAELAPDAPHPDFYSGFEIIASAGSSWAATELETTSSLTPVPLTITKEPDGIIVEGATEGFRYLGAERVEGPYYDLGELAPKTPSTNGTRIIRLRESPTLQSR